MAIKKEPRYGSNSGSDSGSGSESEGGSPKTMSPKHIPELVKLLCLPPISTAAKNKAKDFCIKHGVMIEHYEDYYRHPTKLLRHAQKQNKESHRQKIENLKSRLKARDAEIERLKARKVFNPETYEEALIYLGVKHETAFSEIKELVENGSQFEISSAMAHHAFYIIANQRGEDLEFNLKTEDLSLDGVKIQHNTSGVRLKREREDDEEVYSRSKLRSVATSTPDSTDSGEAGRPIFKSPWSFLDSLSARYPPPY